MMHRMNLLHPQAMRHRIHNTRLSSLLFSKRPYSASSFTSKNAAVLGILRETYDVWERRTPLCPTHVQHLLNQPYIDNVLVQPCSSRVFSDVEYERVGATLTNDLGAADLIVGVKRPLTTEHLLPNKAYMMFSHVIKGQPENMPLLQYILDHSIQLFDYECIVSGCVPGQRPKRLVAFGQFAGRAGTTNTFYPLGRRLLELGVSTPFLHVPPAHMHEDWGAVQDSLKHMGELIESNGLPYPILFCLTGKGGNVYSGAMQVMELLPHKTITVDELPHVHEMTGPQHCIYCLSVGPEDVYHRHDGGPFDRNDYFQNPQDYHSVFHERIAPYILVLVNGMFWDDRYPRLITKTQMKNLYNSGHNRLLLVADISCDVNGSIEFLERTTCIDRPYFQYDPEVGAEVSYSNGGVTVMGVDILPTELPRESSEYFGDALLPVLEKYIESKVDEKANAPVELTNACITEGGSLTPRYQHLESFLKRPSGKVHPGEANATLWLEGHLFDTGFINHALDIIEQNDCTFEIVECHVRKKLDGIARKSYVILRIGAPDDANIARIDTQIHSLMNVMERAECSMKRLDHSGSASKVEPTPPTTTTVTELPKEENILVLGAGLVSKSLVEYLGRDARRIVTVVGNHEDEARSVSKAAKNGRHVALDVQNRMNRVEQLIEESDIVVSLLPAPMHSGIANTCIDQSTDLVTASYESDAMRRLDERAMSKGVRILNEVGLDPGLDHMSAMKMIDDIHERGGVVTGFSSVCGGLPAPEAADNPLMYKFSWSPMGVLSACQNDAVYRLNNEIVEVNGKSLLRAAAPFEDDWPALKLECLPNRNALLYEAKYGIPHAQTLFRGTLRYRGFSDIMSVFQSMGLLAVDNVEGVTWGDVIHNLQRRAGFQTFDDFLLHCAGGDPDKAARAAECIEFLETEGSTPVVYPDDLVASFCEVLKSKCQYQQDERDMVLMHTSIKALFDHGVREEHRSSLQAFGDSNHSAMSKTVGYTAAAATEVLLDHKSSAKGGLLLPTSKELYVPILQALESEGVKFKEEVKINDEKTTRSPITA